MFIISLSNYFKSNTDDAWIRYWRQAYYSECEPPDNFSLKRIENNKFVGYVKFNNEDINIWINKNCKNKPYYSSRTFYKDIIEDGPYLIFDNKQEAIIFKLSWI